MFDNFIQHELINLNLIIQYILLIRNFYNTQLFQSNDILNNLNFFKLNLDFFLSILLISLNFTLIKIIKFFFMTILNLTYLKF